MIFLTVKTSFAPGRLLNSSSILFLRNSRFEKLTENICNNDRVTLNFIDDPWAADTQRQWTGKPIIELLWNKVKNTPNFVAMISSRNTGNYTVIYHKSPRLPDFVISSVKIIIITHIILVFSPSAIPKSQCHYKNKSIFLRIPLGLVSKEYCI